MVNKWLLRLLWLTCLLGILATIHNTAHAATYYVDATDGSDTASGASADSAWKTIIKVNAATFAGGDSILFQKGETWTGIQLTVPKDSLKIAYYGTGAAPTINGNATLQYGIYASGKTGVKIDGLRVTNTRKTSYAYGIFFSTGAQDTVTNCTVDNIYYITNPYPGSLASATDWEHQYGSGIEFNACNGGEISHNTVSDCGSQGINYGTTNGAPISNEMSIHGNDITNCNIMLRVSTGTFQNGVAIQNVRIYDNNFHDHNAYYRCDAWHRNEIQIFCSAYNTSSFDDFTIYNNYFADYTNHTIGETAMLYIENVCTNFKIHHNVFGQGCGYYAIRIYGKRYNYDANHEIYNNTIGTMYQTATDLNAIGIEQAYGCKIKNNILYSQRIAWSVPDANADSGFAADYNLICRLDGAGTTTGIAVLAGSTKTLTTLRAAGFETNGVEVTAANANTVMVNRLADPAVDDDFKLQSGAPAIDNGVDLGYTADAKGDTIPQGVAPEIGAYEYNTTPTPPSGLTQTVNLPRHSVFTFTDNSADEQGFQITYNGVVIDSLAADTVTFSLDNESPGTECNVQIRAYNGAYISGATALTYDKPRYRLQRVR